MPLPQTARLWNEPTVVLKDTLPCGAVKPSHQRCGNASIWHDRTAAGRAFSRYHAAVTSRIHILTSFSLNHTDDLSPIIRASKTLAHTLILYYNFFDLSITAADLFQEYHSIMGL